MYYTVRHTTKFRYSTAISESIMEVRIQPRSEGIQHCLDFRLSTSPMAHVYNYRGENGNRVHHFDVPNRHNHLTITAESIVEVLSPPPLPEALEPTAWDDLDALTADDEYWDSLHPSHFARSSKLLSELIAEFQIQRRDDPLTVVKDINKLVYTTFEYAKKNTRVDSPIDDALLIRRGVCQDFAHIMIALVRSLGIPCRYVSGYLFHQQGSGVLSTQGGATHAWVEVMLPELGWIGFDPTNNRLADDQHIRVAIGRDYADVPPTSGIFRGKAESELSVNVRVYPTEMPPPSADFSLEADWVPSPQKMYEREDGGFFQQNTEQQQ
jgi:transglutaminase-like putative cysteine protease